MPQGAAPVAYKQGCIQSVTTSPLQPALEHATQLAQQAAAPLGYDIVRVRFYGSANRPTLQIMAEKPDGTMNVDDCAALSREVSVLLDVHNAIAENYVLEVSSPGIDRPLTRAKDFARWQGFTMRCETSILMQERRRFKGTLQGLCPNDPNAFVLLDDAVGQITIAVDQVRSASLILTDALLAAHKPVNTATVVEETAP